MAYHYLNWFIKKTGDLIASIFSRYASSILLLACIPLVTTSYFAIMACRENYNFAAQEVWGSKIHQTLSKIYQKLYLDEDAKIKIDIVKTLFIELEQYADENKDITHTIQRLIEDINEFIKSDQNNADHIDLLKKILDVQQKIMDISQISLDPIQETYYLGQLIHRTIQMVYELENLQNPEKKLHLKEKTKNVYTSYGKAFQLTEFIKLYLDAIESPTVDKNLYMDIVRYYKKIDESFKKITIDNANTSKDLKNTQEFLFKLNELAYQNFNNYINVRVGQYTREGIITLLSSLIALLGIFYLFSRILEGNKQATSALEKLEGFHFELEKMILERTGELNEALLQAESASQAKSAFLANMSHELRTPINGIVGVAEYMQTTQLTPAQGEMNGSIIESATSLQLIVNEILDLSEIYAGTLIIKSAPLNVLNVVQSIFNHNKPYAELKKIDLLLNINDEDNLLNSMILGDEGRLRQVINSLVNNAVKFTERGQIEIKVETEGVPDKFFLLVSVMDTGVGIASDKIKSIYDAFSQVDVTSTRRFGGTGLGLTISKKLVNLMGGGITCESIVDHGSRFQIKIPTKILKDVESHVDANNAIEDFTHLSSLNILLVEDNPVNQFVAKAHLENMGCFVTIANHGREALERLYSVPFDLILMDCQMPVMDGYTASKAIRIQGCEIPIIALTANAMEGDRENCLAAGMNDYLSKPYRKDDLFAIMLKNLRDK